MKPTQANQVLNWLKDRVRKDRFSGLTLSILFLVFCYITFLLAGLIEDVVTSDVIVYWDQHLALYLETIRTHQLVEFFLFFTFLGQPLLVVWGLALSIIGLIWTRLTIWIAPLVVSVITSVALVYMGKQALARSRPEGSLFSMHSFSFPSGHSSIAVSLYGFMGLMFLIETKELTTRLVTFTLTFFIVTLVLLSRMFLGVHYLSDVIGGLLVGSLSVTLGLGVYFVQKFNIVKNVKLTENSQYYWKIMVLIAMFLLGWMGFEMFGESFFYQDQLAK